MDLIFLVPTLVHFTDKETGSEGLDALTKVTQFIGGKKGKLVQCLQEASWFNEEQPKRSGQTNQGTAALCAILYELLSLPEPQEAVLVKWAQE